MKALTCLEEELGLAVRDATTLLEAQLAVSLYLERQCERRKRINPAPPLLAFDPAAPAMSQFRTVAPNSTPATNARVDGRTE